MNDSSLQLEQIHSHLPQTQCQLCGYPDCRAYARAVTEGESINLCQPGGLRTLHKLQTITGRQQPAGKISRFHRVVIDEQQCIGCLKCVKACPVQAITGVAKQMHTVIAGDCTGCDLCLPVCPVDCIYPVEAEDPYECYRGNALASVFAQRLRSYQSKQQQEQEIKTKARPTRQQTKPADSGKQEDGRRRYQLLRIDRAIAACRKKGDSRLAQKLEKQKQNLLTLTNPGL